MNTIILRQLPTFILLVALGCQSQNAEESGTNATSPSSNPELTEINALIRQYPDHPDLLFRRASIYYQLNDFGNAERDLKNCLVQDSSLIDAWHLLADTQLDALDSRAALETMETVASIHPDSIRSKFKLSEFQLILKRYPAALQTLVEIQEIDPDNAEAFMLKGIVYKESGDTNRAVRQMQLATRENPQLVDAWINLGQLHESLGSPDALRYFEAGLSVSPSDPNLLHSKAQYLARQGRIGDAKAIYYQLMDNNPYDADPYFDMALLYIDEDSNDLALDHLNLSLKINPTLSRAYFYRGWLKELEGNPEMAKRDYEQVLLLTPEDQDAQEALSRLNK